VANDERVRTVCLLILAFVAGAFALNYLSPVMVPFVLALFFSLALRPVIDFFVRRLHMPTALALVTTIVIGVVILTVLGMLVAESISQVETGGYKAKADSFLDWIEDRIPLRMFGVESTHDAFDAMQKRGTGMLKELVDGLFSFMTDGILVLVFMIFLVAGHKPSTEPETGVWADIEGRVKKYLSTKILVSAGTGLVVFVVLEILGVPLALVFGLFSFLLNFVPNIGSIIAALLPLPIVALDPNISATTAILAITIPGAIQFLIGNVVEPKVMGSAVDLHPVTVLMALIFWGMIWGFVGMLLSTPLTATLKIVLGRIELTQPVADLLAGRKAEPSHTDET